MDNQRLILFIVFSFSLLLLWEAWQGKHESPATAPTATSVPAASVPPAPGQALNAPAAAPAQWWKRTSCAPPSTPTAATCANCSCCRIVKRN